MVKRVRTAACALLVLVQGSAALEACPWRKALAAAMALAVLGSGQALPGVEPAEGDPALAGVADPEACSRQCQAAYDHGLNHCLIYQGRQESPMRVLCLSTVMAELEACERRCEGR